MCYYEANSASLALQVSLLMALGSFMFFLLLLVGPLRPLVATPNEPELPLSGIPSFKSTLQGLEAKKQALLCQLLAGKPADPLHPTPSFCSPPPPAGENKAHFPIATTCSP